MQPQPQRRLRVGRRRRRAAVLMLLALLTVLPLRVLLATATTRDARPGEPAAARVVVLAGSDRISLAQRPFVRSGRVAVDQLARALRARLPARAVVRRGSSTIVFRYRPMATARRAVALGPDGGTLRASRRPISSRTAAPVIAQMLRNDCEAAALQIVLAAEGVEASQRRILGLLPRSSPLDPVEGANGRVWGDPDEGFVGRPEGGGAAGGFGVYPGPVRQVADRLGVQTEIMTREPPTRLYTRLLYGKPVIAWIGLSEGPFATWTSPAGKRISVNFGEHTVVLGGVNRDGTLRVVNPLQGTLERWTKGEFEQLWTRLGRRALAVA